MPSTRDQRRLITILYEGAEIYTEVIDVSPSADDEKIARYVHAALAVHVDPTDRKETR